MKKNHQDKQIINLKERWIKWKRALRLFYLRILRLQGKPEEIAWGMAIGVFFGMTPTVPLHMMLALLVAFLLGKNKIAACLGVWVAVPPALPFIYLLDYKIGQFITSTQGPDFTGSNFSINHLIEKGWPIFYSLLLGGFIFGLICAVPAYFLTKHVIILYRQRRRKRINPFGLSP
jgi:uncharacterized protein